MPEFIDIDESLKDAYNQQVNHPLQSFEWGEFRKKTGVTVIRKGQQNAKSLQNCFTLTLHKIPYVGGFIGYLPKTKIPSYEVLNELVRIAKEHNVSYIQLEPNVTAKETDTDLDKKLHLQKSFHPLFTKYTFVLDLTKTEEELLATMHTKTRYNIKVAQKHGVIITEDNSDNAFRQYLKLTEETTKRQGFYAHTRRYHTLQWETLPHNLKPNQLSSHLLTAQYQEKILTTWILFVFNDTLYYPYGASASEHRNTMSSTLLAWEAIKWGKTNGLKHFDMWGALGENPNEKDPWFGFHQFKERFGPQHTEFIGSYDLVVNPKKYKLLKAADKARWGVLKLKKRLR